MNRIDQIFADRRAAGQRTLMPFICAGHPNPAETGEMLVALQSAGASVVEVGFPFSDPIADGPVIAAAMHEAIGHGITPPMIFEQVAAVRETLTIGVVAMVSISIVQRMGGAVRFSSLARQAGFDGLILPDVPLEESRLLIESAAAEQLTASLLIAPSSPCARAQEIAKASTGFVYLLARAGITGEQTEAPDIASRVAKLRQVTALPIAVGFGVSSPQQVRHVTEHADAAIVGSALVKRLSQAHSRGEDPVAEARRLCEELVSGLFQSPA